MVLNVILLQLVEESLCQLLAVELEAKEAKDMQLHALPNPQQP